MGRGIGAVASVGARAASAWRDGGLDGLRASGRRWLKRQLGPDGEDLGIRPAELASSARPWRARTGDGSGPLDITWLLTPPGPGSGGHTTIFRMVHALEKAGHRCRLAIYDVQGRPAARHLETVRTWWPEIEAPVVELGAREDTDAFVATAWQTAHVLAALPDDGARLYFVQDYEPWFYPKGAPADLAAQTYRFGFDTITIGQALADELGRRHSVEAVAVPFGCDHGIYFVEAPQAERDSVVFYSRPGVARRGFEVAVPALERFHRLRPDIAIHVVGRLAGEPAFPAVLHPTLSPRELNALYQHCAAGLALSYTNVSLVPFELLAAGVVPVMNAFGPARAVLDTRHAVWGAPHPDGLAEALVAGVELQRSAGANAVSADVRRLDWAGTCSAFVGAVERACRAVPAGEVVDHV
jgi:glycosyltransferase involved in cell wall biosynthesis